MAVASASSARTNVGAAGMSVHNLNVYYGSFRAIADVSMAIEPRKITALIGPSGSGKSTFLRALNRLHELQPDARVAGEVLLNGANIYDPRVDANIVRRHIGMVFQKPNPLPTKSIFDNVALGLRLLGVRDQRRLEESVEQALRRSALWDEVKDKLKAPGTALSGGQQQRLCIARALAPEPDILLMDEPAAALDPVATLKIEDLLQELKERFTIVIVTHNMQQAGRSSDNVGVFMMQPDRSGVLVEFAPSARIFTNPSDPRTEAYIEGRIG